LWRKQKKRNKNINLITRSMPADTETFLLLIELEASELLKCMNSHHESHVTPEAQFSILCYRPCYCTTLMQNWHAGTCKWWIAKNAKKFKYWQRRSSLRVYYTDMRVVQMKPVRGAFSSKEYRSLKAAYMNGETFILLVCLSTTVLSMSSGLTADVSCTQPCDHLFRERVSFEQPSYMCGRAVPAKH
jgi:hypothetical protein